MISRRVVGVVPEALGAGPEAPVCLFLDLSRPSVVYGAIIKGYAIIIPKIMHLFVGPKQFAIEDGKMKKPIPSRP